MERMKRLRAAQLNRTFQKDVLSNAHKKANEERDRYARLQIERNAFESRRSPSPPPRLSDICSPCLPAGDAQLFLSQLTSFHLLAQRLSSYCT